MFSNRELKYSTGAFQRDERIRIDYDLLRWCGDDKLQGVVT